MIADIFKLNSSADFSNNPVIEGYVAAKFPAVAALGLTPDKQAKKPEYSTLKLPTSYFQKRKAAGKQLLAIQGNLVKFEALYRNFENQLIQEMSN